MVACDYHVWPLFLSFTLQNLNIRHSATDERNNLKSGNYEPNINIFDSTKYHLYYSLISATMLFRNYFNNLTLHRQI